MNGSQNMEKKTRIDHIKSHYEKNFGSRNENHEILDWESREAQISRFSVIVEEIDVHGKSLLDVGCGLADLYAFFNEMGFSVRYEGVDISQRMIDFSKKRFPDVCFSCVDIFSGDKKYSDSSFDIVFSSGIFNLDLGNNMQFLECALAEFCRISSRYVVFNLLSEKSTDKENRYFYYRQRDVEKLIGNIGFSSARIVEDYLLNDLTVICEK